MSQPVILLIKSILALSLMLLLIGCQKDEELLDQPINSFAMLVDEISWKPSQIGEDECLQTFHGAWSSVTVNGVDNHFFTIEAYKDPGAVTTHESENIFKMQISNIREVGTYQLSNSYKEDFGSYAVFKINKPDGTYSRYINNPNESFFTVELSEFIPLPGLSLTGIEGTFYGTLYNEINPLDSLSISESLFRFERVNWSSFNHCRP